MTFFHWRCLSSVEYKSQGTDINHQLHRKEMESRPECLSAMVFSIVSQPWNLLPSLTIAATCAVCKVIFWGIAATKDGK